MDGKNICLDTQANLVSFPQSGLNITREGKGVTQSKMRGTPSICSITNKIK